MKIIDRYILQQISQPLLVSLGIGLLVLLSERMVRILDKTLGKQNSLSVVFELLGYLVPHYLGLAIPAALFLGLLFGFNRLSRNSEVDAFLAAGISLHRLAMPVIMLSLLLTVIAVYIFGWLQPYTRYAYRALLYTVSNVEVFYLAEEGVFMQAGTRTFILDRLQRDTNTFQRIFLFDYRGKGGAETITAKRGYLVPQKNDPRPLLVLEDGHRLKLESWPEFDTDKPPPRFSSGFFDRVEAPIGRKDATVFRPRGQDERELTFPELIANYNTPLPRATIAELHTELHKRLVSILTIPVLPFLALPFAIGHRRQQRAYRFGVALAILVAYHEIVQQGAVASRVSGTPVWLTMWTPWALLVLFAAIRYWNTCFTLKRDPLEHVYDRLAQLGGAARRGLARLWRRGDATGEGRAA